MAVIVMSSKLYNNLPILITRCSTSCVQLYVLFTVVITVAIIFYYFWPYQRLRYDSESDLPLKLLTAIVPLSHRRDETEYVATVRLVTDALKEQKRSRLEQLLY